MKYGISSWKARIQRLPFMKNAFKSRHERIVDTWYADNGEELRYQYPLNAQSFVIDVGGYRGEWAKKINDMYSPSIYIFEPVPQYAQALRLLFGPYSKVTVYEFGLSDRTEIVPLSIQNENS